MSYDLGQTFYLDKQAVQGADAAVITSVELYFRTKPIQNKTVSGIANPGVTVALCKTKEDGSPDIASITDLLFTSRVEYANINADTTGSTSTKFTFTQPMIVATNSSYAFLIKFDGRDSGFRIFANKAGNVAQNSSSITQVSSGVVDGYTYRITNGFTLTPLTDTDIAFKINVAKFTSLSQTYSITNRAYEILKVSSVSGIFLGGEEILQQRSTLTGTLTVNSSSASLIGSGTTFTTDVVAGDRLVISDGTSGNTDIRVVGTVTNNTLLVLTQAPSFSNASGTYYKTVTGRLFTFDNLTDEMIIQDSTANSTIYLTTSTVIRGVDSGATATISAIRNANVNAVIPNYAINQPPSTKVSLTVNFANTGGSVSSTRKINGTLGIRSYINQYDGVVASRSNEVTAATPFKSFSGELTFSTTNPYISPTVHQNDLDLFIERYSINNDTTDEYQGKGLARARYVSRQIRLTNDQQAEDFKVYLTAFKPQNTDIKVFVRALNPEDNESFDLKDWTELTLDQSSNIRSNPTNIYDKREFTYSVPFFQAGTAVPGQFKTELANAVIVGTSGSVSTDLTVGDVVRVYSQLFTNTHFVDTVVAANTTTFTIAKAVSNTSVVGNGLLVEKITRKNSGFLNIQNGNVFTYYNKALSKFNGYETFAVKIVLLSSDGINAPYVDDVRLLAVSA